MEQQGWKNRKYGEWDDYCIHQAGDTQDAMGDGHPDWFEHYWMMLGPKFDMREQRAPFFSFQMAVHPNVNQMHAYALTCLDNVQYNLRGARPLVHDRLNLSLGPIQFAVAEPGRTWRVKLARNDVIPVHWEIETRALGQHHLLDAHIFQEPDTPHKSIWVPSNRAAVATQGTISVNGETFDAKDYWCIWDHCWGVRSWRGGWLFHVFILAVFESEAIIFLHREDADANPTYSHGVFVPNDGGDKSLLVRQQCDFTFDPGTRELTRATWLLDDSKGARRELKAEVLSHGIRPVAGWSGEEPWAFRDGYRVEGEQWNLLDQARLKELSGRLKHLPYKFSLDGKPGWGTVLHVTSRKHKGYGHVFR